MNLVKSSVFSWEGEVGINSISSDKPALRLKLTTNFVLLGYINTSLKLVYNFEIHFALVCYVTSPHWKGLKGGNEHEQAVAELFTP